MIRSLSQLGWVIALAFSTISFSAEHVKGRPSNGEAFLEWNDFASRPDLQSPFTHRADGAGFSHNIRLVQKALKVLHQENSPFSLQLDLFGTFLKDIPGIANQDPALTLVEPFRSQLELKLLSHFLESTVTVSPTPMDSLDNLALLEFAKLRIAFLATKNGKALPPLAVTSPFFAKVIPLLLHEASSISENPKLLALLKKLNEPPLKAIEAYQPFRNLNAEEWALLRVTLPKIFLSLPVEKGDARKAIAYFITLMDVMPTQTAPKGSPLLFPLLVRSLTDATPEKHFAAEVELLAKASPEAGNALRRITEIFPALQTHSYSALLSVDSGFSIALAKTLELSSDDRDLQQMAVDFSKPQELINFLKKRYKEKAVRYSEKTLLQVLAPIVHQENLPSFLDRTPDVKARGDVVDRLRVTEQILLQKKNPTESEKGSLAAYQLALELIQRESAPLQLPPGSDGREHYFDRGIAVSLDSKETITIHDYADFVVAIEKLLGKIVDAQKRDLPISLPKFDLHKVSPTDIAKMHTLTSNLRRVFYREDNTDKIELPANLSAARSVANRREFRSAFGILDQHLNRLELGSLPGQLGTLPVWDAIDPKKPETWSTAFQTSEQQLKELLKKLFKPQLQIRELMADPKLNALANYYFGKTFAQEFGWGEKAGTSLLSNHERTEIVNLILRAYRQHYTTGLLPLAPKNNGEITGLERKPLQNFFSATSLDGAYLLSQGNQGDNQRALFMHKVYVTLMGTPQEGANPYVFASTFGKSFGQPSSPSNFGPWSDYATVPADFNIFQDIVTKGYPANADPSHYFSSPARMAEVLFDSALSEEQKALEYLVRLLPNSDEINDTQRTKLRSLPRPLLLALVSTGVHLNQNHLKQVYNYPSATAVLAAIFQSKLHDRVKDAIALEVLSDLKKITVRYIEGFSETETSLQEILLFGVSPFAKEAGRMELMKQLAKRGTDFSKDDKGEKFALAYLIYKLSNDSSIPALIVDSLKYPAGPKPKALGHFIREVEATKKAYDQKMNRVVTLSDMAAKFMGKHGKVDSQLRADLLEMDLGAVDSTANSSSSYQDYFERFAPFVQRYLHIKKYAPLAKYEEALTLVKEGKDPRAWLLSVDIVSSTYSSYKPLYTEIPRLLPSVIEANQKMAAQMLKRLHAEAFTNADFIRLFDTELYHSTRAGISLKEFWESQGITVDESFLSKKASPEVTKRMIAFLEEDLTVFQAQLQYAKREQVRNFLFNMPLAAEQWNTGTKFRNLVDAAFKAGKISEDEKAFFYSLRIANDFVNPIAKPVKRLIQRLAPSMSQIPLPLVGEGNLPNPESPSLLLGLPLGERLLLSAGRTYDTTFFVVHGADDISIDPERRATYLKLREEQLIEEIRVLDYQLGHIPPTAKNLSTEKQQMIDALTIKKKELALLGRQPNEGRCGKDLPPSPVKAVTVKIKVGTPTPMELEFEIPVDLFDGKNDEPLLDKLAAIYRKSGRRKLPNKVFPQYAYDRRSFRSVADARKFAAEHAGEVPPGEESKFYADFLLEYYTNMVTYWERRIDRKNGENMRPLDELAHERQTLDQIFHFERTLRRGKYFNEKAYIDEARRKDFDSLGSHKLFFPGAGRGLETLLPKWSEDMNENREDAALAEMKEFAKKAPGKAPYLLSIENILPLRHPLVKAAWQVNYPELYQPLFKNAEFAERFRRAPQELCTALSIYHSTRDFRKRADVNTLMEEVRKASDPILVIKPGNYQSGQTSEAEKQIVTSVPLLSATIGDAAMERIRQLASANTVSETKDRYDRVPSYISTAGSSVEEKLRHFTTETREAQKKLDVVLRYLNYISSLSLMPKQKWEAKNQLIQWLNILNAKEFDPAKYKETRVKVIAALEELERLHKIDFDLHYTTDKNKQSEALSFIRYSFYRIDKYFETGNEKDRSRLINEFVSDLTLLFPHYEKRPIPDHPNFQSYVVSTMCGALKAERSVVTDIFSRGIPEGLERIRTSVEKTSDELEKHLLVHLGDVDRPQFRNKDCEELKPPARPLNETIVNNLRRFLVECQDSSARKASAIAKWTSTVFTDEYRGFKKKQESSLSYVPLENNERATYGALTDFNLDTLKELSPGTLTALNYLVGSQINWAVGNKPGERPLCELLEKGEQGDRRLYQWPNTVTTDQKWNEKTFHIPPPVMTDSEKGVIDDYLDRKVPMVRILFNGKEAKDLTPADAPSGFTAAPPPLRETKIERLPDTDMSVKTYGAPYSAETQTNSYHRAEFKKADLISVIRQPTATNIYRRLFSNLEDPERGKKFLDFFDESFALSPVEANQLQSIVASLPGGFKDWKDAAAKLLTLEGTELHKVQKILLPQIHKLLTKEGTSPNLAEHLMLLGNLPNTVRGSDPDFDCATRLKSLRTQDPKSYSTFLQENKFGS